jgi:hypothetical protein
MLQLARPAQAALLLLRLQKPTAVNISRHSTIIIRRTWLNLDGDPDQPFHHMQDQQAGRQGVTNSSEACIQLGSMALFIAYLCSFLHITYSSLLHADPSTTRNELPGVSSSDHRFPRFSEAE